MTNPRLHEVQEWSVLWGSRDGCPVVVPSYRVYRSGQGQGFRLTQ